MSISNEVDSIVNDKLSESKVSTTAEEENQSNNYENEGSDSEKYYIKDTSTCKTITKFKDTSYVKDFGFSQFPGNFSLFGEIKSKGTILSKTYANNARFFFACEIFDEENDLVLSTRHRSTIGPDKIALMICVQGEEDSRKLSIICIDKDWFEMNCETVGADRECKLRIIVNINYKLLYTYITILFISVFLYFLFIT
jgi:hypothetical protein